MLRHMSHLRKILIDNGAIEMTALNKVAMNTLVNLTPMLTGKFLKEFPDIDSNTPFDNYPYIWKNFSSSGYATLESEDAMMAFNYLAGGFKNPPTDHYTRPFMLAADFSELDKNSASKICLGPKTRIQILLEYLNDFIKSYENIPHWALMFLSSASHNYANDVSRVRHLYEDFIVNSFKSGAFENTLLIFFSDHGIRFGPLRATPQGWFEDRTPFMFFWFPKWFRDENKHLIDNLKTNSRRLITFFDVHETLKDILKFEPNKIINRQISLNQRGISLFNKVPLNRTCISAQIPLEYCVCSSSTTAKLSRKEINRGANFMVNHLNKLISIEAYHCVQLKLLQIIDAKRLGQEKDYLILLTIQVAPSSAIFEGILKVNSDNTIRLQGDINRTNKYGKQSHCVKTRAIREFCMCKDVAV
ncbi:DgyrCDS11652 [Dimorphilus gyrociliatus]|uniref:DgyrCDS11652 n=1 Tax=Dimorphilus gyrociliatus TaxID=2664684 RepID=A0A7I8W407_9ANNE|nr:DgyrCDS11652 [Dimorphilus gyrociliatus]